jgi:hypothetical protein
MSSSGLYAVWAVLAAALLWLWWLSHHAQRSLATPSAVLRRLATGPVSRVAMVVLLMFLGWHLFAR